MFWNVLRASQGLGLVHLEILSPPPGLGSETERERGEGERERERGGYLLTQGAVPKGTESAERIAREVGQTPQALCLLSQVSF